MSGVFKNEVCQRADTVGTRPTSALAPHSLRSGEFASLSSVDHHTWCGPSTYTTVPMGRTCKHCGFQIQLFGTETSSFCCINGALTRCHAVEAQDPLYDLLATRHLRQASPGWHGFWCTGRRLICAWTTGQSTWMPLPLQTARSTHCEHVPCGGRDTGTAARSILCAATSSSRRCPHRQASAGADLDVPTK